MRTLLLPAFIFCLTVTAGAQTPPRSAAELARLGPQVGQPVPDFALQDQRGERRMLKSILGPNGALLVFFRSADW
jgi:hypothetical protein